MEGCNSRGLKPATIRSEAEQAAVTAAIYDAQKRLTQQEFAGSQLSYIFTGGLRQSLNGPWFWIETGEKFYSSNETGSENWRTALLVDDVSDDTAYLCINAVSFEWAACEAYDDEISYMCEERGHQVVGTYKRQYASPEITSVHPQSVTSQEILTITGRNLNQTLDGSLVTPSDVNVTIAARRCNVNKVNDTIILCTLPGVGAGVYPVRVVTPLGQAGPAELPLVYVQHTIANVTPAAGSVCGGQIVTVSGTNFPTTTGHVNVNFELWVNGSTTVTPFALNNSISGASNSTLNTSIACDVVNVTATKIVCKTGAVRGCPQHNTCLDC